MKKSIFATLAFVMIAFMLSAQKPLAFAAKTAKAEKIKVMFDFPSEGRNSKNGAGYSANMDMLKQKPKKVALISFYLYDPACGKSSGGTYTGVAKVACWRTVEDKAQKQIDGFYTSSIEVMKAEYKSYGMELLTPDEFLDTEDKEDFYYGFSQETAKKEKTDVTIRKAAGTTISSVAEATVSTIKISPKDKGYRAFFVANEKMGESQMVNFKQTGVLGANRKMTSSLGYELCKGLGVDAVVVCYIVTRKPKMKKEDYAINAVSMYMFGPNPIIESEDDKNRGQFYCGARYFTKPLMFESQKTGTNAYESMGNVMKALSKKVCNWVINKKSK